LRHFYGETTSDGRLPLQPYLQATIRHRQDLVSGRVTLAAVAQKEKLNAKYLQILWRTLTDKEPSFPLDRVRARWQQASAKDIPALAAEVAGWQKSLWKLVPIGSYRDGNTIRQLAHDPAIVESQTLKLKPKPAAGQNEIVLYLLASEIGPNQEESLVIWHRPRLEGGKNPPLLVRDHSQLEKERFGKHPQGKAAEEASLVVPANKAIAVKLPAELFKDREFVVEGRLDSGGTDRVVQFQVLTAPPTGDAGWDGKSPLVAAPGSAAARQLLQGFTAFRRCFPQFICYPRIVPEDEVVCLKLTTARTSCSAAFSSMPSRPRSSTVSGKSSRFITQWPVTEHKNLPLFIGFVTQDNPKELVTYFEGLREPFRKRAEQFEKEVEAAAPRQLEMLVAFAGRAYRRPLKETEKAELLGLHAALRKKDMAHEEAFRSVLTRVLVAPSFLYRVEQPPAGKAAGAVNDWELATRLSYFLWSTLPDEELRQAAAAGKLRDAKMLTEQTQRMLKDGRLRALSIEFGTQWIHVRGFDELKEKNEQLFPMFDDKLRKAIYEESVLFFQDLFQSDQPVTRILDADYAFLNETLAKHYGIPNVAGQQWRRRRWRAAIWPGRHPRFGERASQGVGCVADQPGASRQLGSRNFAGRKAAAAAAERAQVARGRKEQRWPDDAATGRQAYDGRGVRRLPSTHRPVRLRPGKI